VADELAAAEVFGASLLEVGFPHPKEDFSDRHYLGLWDALASRGVFLTGDGDSDNHHATADGWLHGNNFVTFVGLPEDTPATEESIVASLVRGSCFAADPTACRHLSLTAGDRPMGSILVGALLLVAGSWLHRHPMMIASVLGVVLGIVVLKQGWQASKDAQRIKRGGGMWIPGAVLAAAELLIGVRLIFSPLSISRLVLTVAGIAMVVCGVCNLVAYHKSTQYIPGAGHIIDADE
jgi:uncharacterized membrane protein HdeD (DUF308 family)